MSWFLGKNSPDSAPLPPPSEDLPADQSGEARSRLSELGILSDEEKSEPADPSNDWYLALKRRLHQEVIGAIDMTQMQSLSEPELRKEIHNRASAICANDSHLSGLAERDRLIQEVMNEAFGYGPIEDLMKDHDVSDILINGPRQVFVEKRGTLHLTKIAFHDEHHLMHILQRVVAHSGRRVDENSPMVDARLPDGSRLNAVVRPVALNGPLVSIRRFGARPLTAKDLLKNESLTEDMLEFLAACVRARVNIVVSGGAGSGKTTLLNCLSRYIHESERIATIEDAAELMLQQPHVAKMETRPDNNEGGQSVTMRDLVRNSLRMRPDRIIVGECRGSEALDMLQAMNTGHEGSLTTIHSNTPRDALARLEVMVGAAGYDLPLWVIRNQISSAINLVVQVSRLIGGKRKVVKISEITGIQSDVVMMHDIFEYVQTGVDDQRSAIGHFEATGLRPECLEKLTVHGIRLPLQIFEPRRMPTQVDSQ